jgi:hypothetical protein
MQDNVLEYELMSRTVYRNTQILRDYYVDTSFKEKNSSPIDTSAKIGTK